MAPSLGKRFRSKFKDKLQLTSSAPDPTLSAPLQEAETSNNPSLSRPALESINADNQPDNQPNDQSDNRTNDGTNEELNTTSEDPSSTAQPSQSTLQNRLWNNAYEELAKSDPKVVDEYEKILSSELQGNDGTSNKIASSRETRDQQMQRLVQIGLDRTKKDFTIKKGLDDAMQAVQSVRGIIEKAAHASTKASIVWAGLSLGLEVRIDLDKPLSKKCLFTSDESIDHHKSCDRI